MLPPDRPTPPSAISAQLRAAACARTRRIYAVRVRQADLDAALCGSEFARCDLSSRNAHRATAHPQHPVGVAQVGIYEVSAGATRGLGYPLLVVTYRRQAFPTPRRGLPRTLRRSRLRRLRQPSAPARLALGWRVAMRRQPIVQRLQPSRRAAYLTVWTPG